MKLSALKKEITKLFSTLRGRHWLIPMLTALLVLLLTVTAFALTKSAQKSQVIPTSNATVVLPAESIALPKPDLRSGNSIEAVLKNRRSRRDYQDNSLSLKQVSQMLWAAQGVTVDWGGRTTPSAKSTYPLSVYLIASKVEGLDPGEYQYIPGDRTPVHALNPIKKVELQKALYEAVNESSFKSAPAVLIITGSMGKMAEAYGGLPHDKEVYLEAGHAAQNLYLQAESLHLGMVTITSFSDIKVKDLVTIPSSETLIYLIPFGIPK